MAMVVISRSAGYTDSGALVQICLLVHIATQVIVGEETTPWCNWLDRITEATTALEQRHYHLYHRHCRIQIGFHITIAQL